MLSVETREDAREKPGDPCIRIALLARDDKCNLNQYQPNSHLSLCSCSFHDPFLADIGLGRRTRGETSSG